MSSKKIKINPADQQLSFVQPHLEKVPYIGFLITLMSAALAAITAFFYYPSLRYAFQFDDIANISRVFTIRHLTFSEAFFSGTRWIPFWINAVNYRLGRFDPFYFRLFNVGFHICTGLLIFFLSWFLLKKYKDEQVRRYALFIASTASVLFLLHPVQTQTVSYVIQGRMEGLASLCVIAMVLCFTLYAQVQNKIAQAIGLLFLLLFSFASCGTKEISIVAPALLMIVDWFFLAQGSWPAFKKRFWIHGLVTLILVSIYVYFLKPRFFLDIIGLKVEARNNIGNMLTDVPNTKILPLHFFISQFKVILHYLHMFVWPFSMSVEYDWKLVKNFFAADCLLPLMALCLLAMYVLARFRKNNTDFFVFSFLWFFISLAPRSTIIPSSELLADYKTYLASYGIFLMLAYGASMLVRALFEHIRLTEKSGNVHRIALCSMAILLAMPLGFFTYQRNKVWRSAEEFWTNIIQNAPGKARAYNNLGVALSERGALREAIPLFKKAISMDHYYPDPWNNLAVAYSSEKKNQLAIDTLKRAVTIHRYYPEAYNNLASFYIIEKDYDMAEKMLKVALELRPHYGKAYYNYGKLHLEKGDKDKSLMCFQKACMEGDLDNEAGFTVYANAAVHFQKYDHAAIAYEKLAELKPDNIEFRSKLAHAYLMNNESEKAIAHLKMVLQRDMRNGLCWYNLGECYMHMQDTHNALNAYQQAQQLQFNSPFLPLRLATCFEKIGAIAQAQSMLQLLINDEKAPEHLKVVARNGIASYKQRGLI